MSVKKHIHIRSIILYHFKIYNFFSKEVIRLIKTYKNFTCIVSTLNRHQIVKTVSTSIKNLLKVVKKKRKPRSLLRS